MDKSLMAVASDLTSQPKDKEEVIAEVAVASVEEEEVVDSIVTVEVAVVSVAAVDSIETVAEVLVVAGASAAIAIVEEATEEVTEVIVMEAEDTELVHCTSDMPIRKF